MNKKVKQRDITDCGAACLASVAAHYNLGLPVSRIRQIAGTDQKGTNAWGLVKAAEQMGFSAKGVKGDAEALPGAPFPAIAHVVVNKILHHYVVVYQISGKKVEYMDPQDGCMHKVKIEEFAQIWSGVLILMAPGNNFVAKNEKVSNIQRFIFLLKPHRSILVQSLVGAVFYTILGLSTSIYIQKITDYVLVDRNLKLLNLLSVVMISILLIQLFIGIAKSIFVLRTGQQIDLRLILGYYKHLLTLPQRFFDTMRVGEIISRINDAVKIRAFINETAISLMVNVFIVFFSFALMFIYSWKLALTILTVVPLYAIVYYITNLLNEVSRLTSEISSLEKKAKFTEEEIKETEVLRSEMEEELNIILAEKSKLISKWKSTLSGISNRDAALTQVRTMLTEHKNLLNDTKVEADIIRARVGEEQRKNEVLVNLRDRLENVTQISKKLR